MCERGFNFIFIAALRPELCFPFSQLPSLHSCSLDPSILQIVIGRNWQVLGTQHPWMPTSPVGLQLPSSLVRELSGDLEMCSFAFFHLVQSLKKVLKGACEGRGGIPSKGNVETEERGRLALYATLEHSRLLGSVQEAGLGKRQRSGTQALIQLCVKEGCSGVLTML